MNSDFNELVFILLFFGLFLIPTIFFLLTQQNTLKTIQPHNRFMSPGQVWLQLIPVFGMIWQFFVVTRIANSIRKEISSQNNTFSFETSNNNYFNENGPRPTYEIGIAYCVLLCCGIIPLLGTIASLAGIVCWIVYWVKLNEQKNKIEQMHYSVDPPPYFP